MSYQCFIIGQSLIITTWFVDSTDISLNLADGFKLACSKQEVLKWLCGRMLFTFH